MGVVVSVPFIANAAGSVVWRDAFERMVILRELVPADSKELGWYGAASMIARLSALMSPVLSGVLVPMMSRAKHRSEDEFFKILRRGLEGVIVIAMPLTLMLALGADFIVVLPLKAAFLPAARSLAWLAPTFVLAYANVLLWVTLMILDRSWTITIVSFAGPGALADLHSRDSSVRDRARSRRGRDGRRAGALGTRAR